MNHSMGLPLDIPWKLIAVSQDMMDTRPGNRKYPFRWRSSIGISAFEPGVADLPEELCDERITLLKVTCSITGYQPSAEEREAIQNGQALAPIRLSGFPVEELDRAISEYFGCYGVQLQVAVFPPSEVTDLNQYPHIVDFEPKTRDLYQVTMEEGEILSASNSETVTDKSYTKTNSVETGLSIQAKAQYGSSSGAHVQATGTLTHKWGSTEQDGFQVQTDSSTDRRERQAVATQLTQMYNLLTGYHAGTNRALFLMLPRPHTLQPTDRRTFAQGFRFIEGIQDFFLIVMRRKDQESFRVEATLETAHFPDDPEIERPDPAADDELGDEVFVVRLTQPWGGDARIENHPSATYNLSGGWRVDRNRGDPLHRGIDEISNFAPTWNRLIEEYSYRAVSDTGVQVFGKLRGGETLAVGTSEFHRAYRVYKRRSRSVESDQPARVTTPLLLTSRSLFVRAKSGEHCVEPLEITDQPTSLVLEDVLRQSSTSGSSRDRLRTLERTIVLGAGHPHRRPLGAIGYLASDYLSQKVSTQLSKDQIVTMIKNLFELPPEMLKRIGDMTVLDLYSDGLESIGKKFGITVEEVAKLRTSMLGVPDSAFKPKQN
jgi:hypothetical protein